MYEVMIVDDEPRMRQGLASIINWEEYGFTVTEIVADGKQAFDLFCLKPPSLMIIDMKMPEISGIDLIQMVRKIDKHIRFLILSGHAEFDYAKKAILYNVSGYLLKPVDEEELISYLMDIKNNLDQKYASSHLVIDSNNEQREQAIQAALLGKVTEEVLTCFQQVIKWEQYYVLLVKYYREDKFRLQDLKCMLSEAIDQDGILFTLDTQIGVLIRDNDSTASVYFKLKTVFDRFGVFFITALSQRADQVMELAHRYQESSQLINNSFFFMEESTITKQSSCICNYVEVPDEPLSTLEEQLLYSVEIGNFSDIHQLVWAIVVKLVNKGYTEGKIKTLCIQLLSATVNKLGSEYPEKGSLLSQRLSKLMGIEKLYTVTQLVTFMHHYIKTMMEQIDWKEEQVVVHKMIHLIERNYHRKVQLDNIAEVLHYHKVYLGKLFKEHTGEYFNTYLDKVRIENSKKLLKQGHKVYQVAEKVGYSNSDYFHSKFKKYVGVSPSVFRKRNKTLS